MSAMRQPFPLKVISSIPNTLAVWMVIINAGTIPCGSGASTTAQWYQLLLNCDPGFEPNSKIWANNSCSNGMALDQAVPPQHMNNLKHLMDGGSGCGIHSMWVWSLNHSCAPGFELYSQTSGLTRVVVMV